MIDWQNKKILLVVAHPDDEILGNGATMHKLISNFNCRVRALILGEGLTSRADEHNPNDWNEQLKLHHENASKVQSIIGFESVKLFNLPDNRFDSIQLLDIIKIIEKEKIDFEPEIIFTHHGGDLNIDHQRTFEAVNTATRPLEHEKVNTIITFETPSGTEWQSVSDPRRFLPNLFIEVSKIDLDKKIDAMEAYNFEKRPYPHPRSPEALRILAKRYGVMVGKEYVEAFQLIRSILK